MEEDKKVPLVVCPRGDHLIFVRSNGSIVAHIGSTGYARCPASETEYKKPELGKKLADFGTELEWLRFFRESVAEYVGDSERIFDWIRDEFEKKSKKRCPERPI